MGAFALPLIVAVGIAFDAAAPPTLALSADGLRLELDGMSVFLNGINLAWISYGSDFNTSAAVGYGDYVYCMMRQAMRFVADNGGNGLRVWMFSDLVLGEPFSFTPDGMVSGLRAGVVEMATTLLDSAHELGVLVVLSLWNGALVRSPLDCSFYSDSAKLDSFVAHALTPLARALAGHPALAMWEVVNEPEGVLDLSIPPAADVPSAAAVCHDTASVIACAGADQPGWNTHKGGTCLFSLEQLQRFVNVQAAALKSADPTHLVTLGSWSPCSVSTLYGGAPVFSAECLRRAGGQQAGTIDVYQVHSYPKEADGAAFAPNSPYLVNASAYGLGAPVVIGEISNRWSDSAKPGATAAVSMGEIHSAARAFGYAGVFSWAWTCVPRVDSACISRDEVAVGLRAAAAVSPLRPRVPWDPRGPLPFLRPGEAAELAQQQARLNQKNYVCACGSNRSPDSRYSCSEQAMWGKCEATWMERHCLGWCHNCNQPLEGAQPTPGAPVAVKRGWRVVAPDITLGLALALALALALILGLTLTLGFTLTLNLRRRATEMN
jgi:mannan endo-1,4-beta-mannosidase